MINRASGVAVQDTEKYKAIAAADAMRDAAKNPSGLAGEGLGAGLGLAMGFGMAQQIAQNTAPPHPLDNTDSKSKDADSNFQRLSPAELKTKLKELKELKDEGLINDADFEE